jgi:tartronate-semialdehyde synthase
LGYELPAGIGAKIACPNDPVVVVVGDGGLLFMSEELAVAGQYKLPIIIVVVNNGNLGLIRQNQKYAYGYELGIRLAYSQEPIFPDNIKLAEAFGGKGERIFDAKDLKAAFERGMKFAGPYLIDVMVETDADCSMGIAVNAVREFV